MFVLMLLGLPQSLHYKVGNGFSPLSIPNQSVKDQEVPASKKIPLWSFSSLSKVSRASRYSSLSLYFTMSFVSILPSVRKELHVLGHLINVHCTLCFIWILYWSCNPVASILLQAAQPLVESPYHRICKWFVYVIFFSTLCLIRYWENKLCVFLRCFQLEPVSASSNPAPASASHSASSSLSSCLKY